MIRILIDRHLKEGKKKDFLTMLKELRAVGMQQPGFISGETLGNTEDPSNILVISTWRSLKDWKTWQKSEQRIKLYKKIEPFLVESKVTVYEVMATEE